MDALWPCTYLIASFKRLQCVLISFLYMARVICEICEISRTLSDLVFGSHASFIPIEVNLLNSALDGIYSILLI